MVSIDIKQGRECIKIALENMYKAKDLFYAHLLVDNDEYYLSDNINKVIKLLEEMKSRSLSRWEY